MWEAKAGWIRQMKEEMQREGPEKTEAEIGMALREPGNIRRTRSRRRWMGFSPEPSSFWTSGLRNEGNTFLLF